jgi:hypothetical protein
MRKSCMPMPKLGKSCPFGDSERMIDKRGYFIALRHFTARSQLTEVAWHMASHPIWVDLVSLGNCHSAFHGTIASKLPWSLAMVIERRTAFAAKCQQDEDAFYMHTVITTACEDIGNAI